MILQRVSPVTHSIGNCVKRVVVIAASVVFFRNPVSLQNALGECAALRVQCGLARCGNRNAEFVRTYVRLRAALTRVLELSHGRVASCTIRQRLN